jgi:hypothetical protein
VSDEDKLHQASAKAVRAQHLLENELYVESFKALEEQLIAAWIASAPRDVDGRERCFNQIHANRKQRDYFQSIVNNGKLAAAELKALAETADRKKFRII